MMTVKSKINAAALVTVMIGLALVMVVGLVSGPYYMLEDAYPYGVSAFLAASIGVTIIALGIVGLTE